MISTAEKAARVDPMVNKLLHVFLHTDGPNGSCTRRVVNWNVRLGMPHEKWNIKFKI